MVTYKFCSFSIVLFSIHFVVNVKSAFDTTSNEKQRFHIGILQMSVVYISYAGMFYCTILKNDLFGADKECVPKS